MMVPRSSERTGDVALNALGFAGTTHIGISRPLLAPPNSKLLQLALPSHQRYTLSSRSIGPPSRDAPCALHSRVGAGEGAWANAHSFRGWGATMRSRARKTTGRFAIIVIAVVVQS
eukprot:1187179-Prorocentrum_minimum.AAC.1